MERGGHVMALRNVWISNEAENQYCWSSVDWIWQKWGLFSTHQWNSSQNWTIIELIKNDLFTWKCNGSYNKYSLINTTVHNLVVAASVDFVMSKDVFHSFIKHFFLKCCLISVYVQQWNFTWLRCFMSAVLVSWATNEVIYTFVTFLFSQMHNATLNDLWLI